MDFFATYGWKVEEKLKSKLIKTVTSNTNIAHAFFLSETKFERLIEQKSDEKLDLE